jgi:prepilin-type N-terminal cleavage/methylation domain-containing protein
MSAKRQGFGLIEVIIAMLILSVGVLAMGASTGYILNQIRASELRTERMIIVRGAAERIQSMAWEDIVAGPCQQPLLATDRYSVTCTVTLMGSRAHVRLISSGPGFTGGRVQTTAVDTTMLSIARRIQ